LVTNSQTSSNLLLRQQIRKQRKEPQEVADINLRKKTMKRLMECLTRNMKTWVISSSFLRLEVKPALAKICY